MDILAGRISKLEENTFGMTLTLHNGKQCHVSSRDTEWVDDNSVGDNVSILLFDSDRSLTVIDGVEYRMASKIENAWYLKAVN